MAWPRLRNRKSAAPSATSSNGGGPELDGTQPQPAAPERAAKPADRGRQRWPDSNPTVTPSPAEPPETADPLDAPFWESWAPVDESAELDDPGDGLPEEGPADDAVTDVDPQPRRSWDPVVTVADDAPEQPKAEGIGQHLGNLAHLSGNPRTRAWQWRAIVAIIAGVAFGILLHDWKWGLTFAVLAAIADTIIRSRVVFNGPAGVRLNRAQKNTLRQLDSLERKGYRSMHVLTIPGTEEQIDHLVIGPAGVFFIDSENWHKGMPVRASGHLKLWHGPTSMNDRLDHVHWEADQVAALLSRALGSPVTVRAAMAVYGPALPWDVVEIRDVDVFTGAKLRRYLRRRARRRDAHPLSESEIERIDKAAHEVFGQPPRADHRSRRTAAG